MQHKDWALPPSLERVRRRLGEHADGDSQMVGILAEVTSDGTKLELVKRQMYGRWKLDLLQARPIGAQ